MKELAVLLPAYNAAAYLQESVDSVLSQTYSGFDLYIYDDCSSDDTAAVIDSFNDPRVIYIRNEKNLGIARTLNAGLVKVVSKYKYIARMDADDWCYPDRFAKQLKYLNDNPSMAMIGCQSYFVKDINSNPDRMRWEFPVHHEYIKCNLLFSSSFGHPTIIFRSQFLLKHSLRYDELIRTCEDYDLWTRIVMLGETANLPEPLMKIRILESSNHRALSNRKIHIAENAVIISKYWQCFGISFSVDDIHHYYFNTDSNLSRPELKSRLKVLIAAFNKLYDMQEDAISVPDRGQFQYLLIRRIAAYWKRMGHRSSFSIWVFIIRNIRFMNKGCIVKSMIR